MFAHITLQRQSVRLNTAYQNSAPQGSKTYLSIAVGIALSCFTMQVQAANGGQIYNELPVTDEPAIESPQVIYERLDNPNAPVNNRNLVSNDVIAQQTRLFFECTQVQTGAARLACFDKVAEQGKTPNNAKQPLDLAKTFKSTLFGNPQFVLAENTNEAEATAVEATTVTADTVLVAKDEAQILEEVGVTQSDIEKYTPLSLAYDLDKNSERGTWTARPHHPIYILPLYYTVDPNLNPSSPSREEKSFTSNDIRDAELKLQVSLKTKVAEDLFDTNADLWFGYTQQSHWQVYNEDNSRPFRATDYQPEIFLTQPVKANLPFGGRLRMLGAGAVHHSNGQSDPLSRSWNRVYLMGGAEWGRFSIVPRVWARVDNEDNDRNDNPDIEDFMGHGDVTLSYDFLNRQSISSTLRYNNKTDKGAVQIDYVYPLSDNVNGYVQLFQGYGESLINYNHETTAIGIGIVLNDWKGL